MPKRLRSTFASPFLADGASERTQDIRQCLMSPHGRSRLFAPPHGLGRERGKAEVDEQPSIAEGNARDPKRKLPPIRSRKAAQVRGRFRVPVAAARLAARGHRFLQEIAFFLQNTRVAFKISSSLSARSCRNAIANATVRRSIWMALASHVRRYQKDHELPCRAPLNHLSSKSTQPRTRCLRG